MDAPLITLRNITKRYGTGEAAFLALKGVSFDVHQGEFLAVMGPSGSGKSTTMNIIGALDRPTGGEYLFKGVHVENMTRDERALLRRHNMGFVFQGFNLLARTSALENVELPLLYRGVPAKERHEAAMAALERVGLMPWAHHTPSELSGGQQQRVAIARALINKPKILLADEPTGNLDANNAWEIMKLMEEINEQGTTVVVVTHNLEIVKAMNKRVITMQKGVVVDDTASDHYGKDTSVEQDDDLFDDFLDDGGDDDYAN